MKAIDTEKRRNLSGKKEKMKTIELSFSENTMLNNKDNTSHVLFLLAFDTNASNSSVQQKTFSQKKDN